jgi:hypothetical protein
MVIGYESCTLGRLSKDWIGSTGCLDKKNGVFSLDTGFGGTFWLRSVFVFQWVPGKEEVD